MTNNEGTPMSRDHNEILATVSGIVRRTIDEDWIADYEIGFDTSFYDDLEIESIEFVKIADAIQLHYGTQLEIATWLSGKTIRELIGLSVGQLTDYIAGAITKI
jgi:acyl carrier protein